MTHSGATILLVEDNDDDAFFFERALKSTGIRNKLSRVENGQEAIDFLFGDGQFGDRSRYPLPSLIFLDLKLPVVSGLEVLASIREKSELQHLVIVVLSSSNEPKDFSEARRLGAHSYRVKPLRSSHIIELVSDLKLDWMKIDTNPLNCG